MDQKYDVNLLEVQLENNEYTNEELYKIIKGIKKKTRYVKLNKKERPSPNKICTMVFCFILLLPYFAAMLHF